MPTAGRGSSSEDRFVRPCGREKGQEWGSVPRETAEGHRRQDDDEARDVGGRRTFSPANDEGIRSRCASARAPPQSRRAIATCSRGASIGDARGRGTSSLADVVRPVQIHDACLGGSRARAPRRRDFWAGAIRGTPLERARVAPGAPRRRGTPRARVKEVMAREDLTATGPDGPRYRLRVPLLDKKKWQNRTRRGRAAPLEPTPRRRRTRRGLSVDRARRARKWRARRRGRVARAGAYARIFLREAANSLTLSLAQRSTSMMSWRVGWAMKSLLWLSMAASMALGMSR